MPATPSSILKVVPSTRNLVVPMPTRKYWHPQGSTSTCKEVPVSAIVRIIGTTKMSGEKSVQEDKTFGPSASQTSYSNCSWPSETIAKPIHIRRVEEALRLEPLLSYIESMRKLKRKRDASDVNHEPEHDVINCVRDADDNKIYNGVVITRAERKSDKSKLYNFSRVKKSRKWLKNILLSDSSSEDDCDMPITDDHLRTMLKEHVYNKRCKQRYQRDKDLKQYQYYSVGLLSNYDKFYDHQKMVIGPKKKLFKERKMEKQLMKEKQKKENAEAALSTATIKEEELSDGEISKASLLDPLLQNQISVKSNNKVKMKKLSHEQIVAKRRKIWMVIAKKEIPRAQKQKTAARKESLAGIKKVAKECQKECRKLALISQKAMKEASTRVRRLSKEMQAYWKRFEKVEKEHRKKAEREAQEKRKMDVELREMKRQQRKLNFLITQTELYAHFMARKLTGDNDNDREAILQNLEEEKPTRHHTVNGGGTVISMLEDDYDSEEMKAIALGNAEAAYKSHQNKKREFDFELRNRQGSIMDDHDSVFANPSMSATTEWPQPAMFQGKLKSYQLKGMNWLANLYDQGISGILADEMGLGKTVQSIAFLAHLAESQCIWGPFLIIAPASTLHNWQQEVTRFVPNFKVVPYWGNTQDRKILRKFWNKKHIHLQESSFHIVITSYQLIVQDAKYFQQIDWHYMILDEAQAIKSSASSRWKSLLVFKCRNRLLLTGTPIQNSMAELWALLHFIMPTLFDSHDEFNEWFSKDIESHVEKQSNIDKNQLSRLHMILKPFMLRRVKKDVENELSDKIEILLCCPLTRRQKLLYQGIKNKISIDDLLQSSASFSASGSATTSLMNLVMQFRKVCNHPELFERREIRSPFSMRLNSYYIPKLVYREAMLDCMTSSKHHLLFNKFYLFNSEHIHRSLFPPCSDSSNNDNHCNSFVSFLRFLNVSPAELEALMLRGLLVRWTMYLLWLKNCLVLHHQRQFLMKETSTRYLDNNSFHVDVDRPTSFAGLLSSHNLSRLVFIRTCGSIYTYTDHTLHCMAETPKHRKIRARRLSSRKDIVASKQSGMASPIKNSCFNTPRSPIKMPISPVKMPLSPVKVPGPHSQQTLELNLFPHIYRKPTVIECIPTEVPSFLYYSTPKAVAGYMDRYTSDRSSEWQLMRDHLCGTAEARLSLLYGSPEIYDQVRSSTCRFRSISPQGLLGIRPAHGVSHVYIPDKETLVTDAGKLGVLDRLLTRLKSEDHRVLIYSQMTRMIDLLEEYLWLRKHTYMRLDGSSKISDRRDMVADFQARTDIFVFLLSTRAGGLGINLTAADTVIFYDSDWNPTVDQQAMDRAHRLGQTKQVTVYRLICKGTIEERILQRAKEKSDIQQMVISGGSFAPDILKPKEVVSLLLDDDEMEQKLHQKQDEKKQKEEQSKERDAERKRKQNADKPKSRRGPGRPPKRQCPDDSQNRTENVTVQPFDDSSVVSMSSLSAPPSPRSEVSFVSEVTMRSESVADDESCDGLLIVDDVDSLSSVTTVSTPSKSVMGRPRGRPKGSASLGHRSRRRGSIQKSLSAAEAAAIVDAKKSAFAAHGYSFTDGSSSGILLAGAQNSRSLSPSVGAANGSLSSSQ